MSTEVATSFSSNNSIKKRGRVVLEEEEYVSQLEKIIEREYFPHLDKMKKQLDLLNCHEKFSMSTLRSTYIRLFDKLPCTKNFDHNSHESYRNMSISEFFKHYTSDDNESFKKLHEKSLEEHRKRYHWVYDSIEEGDINSGSQRKAGMLMLYYIGNKVLSGKERDKIDGILNNIRDRTVGDDKKNGSDMHLFRVRNQLMFYPELKDSLETCQVGITSNILPANSGSTEEIKRISNGSTFVVPLLPKKTARNNCSVNSKSIQSSQTYEAGQDLVNSVDRYLRRDKRMLPIFASPLEANHTPSTYSEVSESMLYTSNKKIYNPVPMSPLTAPTDGILQSPLMTWGEIAATPLILQQSGRRTVLELQQEKVEKDDEAKSLHFHMQPTRSREVLARQLDARNKHKAKIKSSSSTNSIGASSFISSKESNSKKKLSDLTPAAQALAKKLQQSVIKSSQTPLFKCK